MMNGNYGTSFKTGGQEYIRHPEDIPIDVYIQPEPARRKASLSLDDGRGISFRTNVYLQHGMLVRITIPVVQPTFETQGWVMWCRKIHHGFIVGLALVENRDAFRVRMVEQLCHIEHYRKNVQEAEGRNLSKEEAAHEWIGKYAGNFPAPEAATTRH